MKMGDPSLNILQVFQEVRKLVKEKSEGKQIPWVVSVREGGVISSGKPEEMKRFCILKNEVPPGYSFTRSEVTEVVDP